MLLIYHGHSNCVKPGKDERVVLSTIQQYTFTLFENLPVGKDII